MPHSENSLEVSQNHKILEAGKVLWRLSSPIPLQVQDFVLFHKVRASPILQPIRVPLKHQTIWSLSHSSQLYHPQNFSGCSVC